MREELNKSRVHSSGVADVQFNTKLAVAVKAFLDKQAETEPSDPLLKKLLNVKWSLTTDLLDAPTLPKAVAIAAEQLQGLLKALTALDYFESQKKWAADMMKQSKVPMTASIIVKPMITRKVRDLIVKELNAITFHHNKASAKSVADLFEPQFTQSNAGASRHNSLSTKDVVHLDRHRHRQVHLGRVRGRARVENSELSRHRGTAALTAPRRRQGGLRRREARR